MGIPLIKRRKIPKTKISITFRGNPRYLREKPLPRDVSLYNFAADKKRKELLLITFKNEYYEKVDDYRSDYKRNAYACTGFCKER